MDNEDFVRQVWKSVKKGWKDNDSYAPDLFLLDLPDGQHFFDPDYKKVWEVAAAYTKTVIAEFAQWKAAKAAVAKLKNPYLDTLLNKRFNRKFSHLQDGAEKVK